LSFYLLVKDVMLLLYKVYLKYMDKPQELVRHINTEKNKFQAYVQK